MRRVARRVAPLQFVLLICAHAPQAAAQQLSRPHLAWYTVETTHFVIHFPDSLRDWTMSVAPRLDAVHEHVSRLVESAPRERVTVLVDDPLNVANGFALPFLDAPTMYLFPTPPSPDASIGHHREWGELVSVHEYAHLAHLARPSRNPRERILWRLLPLKIGPVARRAPRWVIEGYATYIEGRLTGSGRPHSAGRAAVLRQWALEGELPRYEQLNGSRDFMGGAMAYLAGSAFLDWLVERRGEEALADLWHRLSARQRRDFDEAFAGVFEGTPAELYGRFSAELTGQALQVERLLTERGPVAGELVQRLHWQTGAPAVSRDGSLLAIVRRERDRPSRLEIWRTRDDPPDERAVRRRERARRLDPHDVPAIRFRPPPKEAIATLHPASGRAHDAPRFLPDGRHVLVVRFEPTGDGSLLPDVFVWSFESGRLRRVTRGAGVRHADPSPDGKTAVGDRCLYGRCDVVRVDLATGAVTTITEGSPTVAFHRPRFSPDGRRIAAAVHREGRWRIALIDPSSGAHSFADPDDGADRYHPAFLPGGESLVVVSELGGIPNLERISAAGGGASAPAASASTTLTRLTGAAQFPEPDQASDRIYFLRLHARGFDLASLTPAPESAPPRGVLALEQALAPAVPVSPPDSAIAFEARPTQPPHPYGLGERRLRVLPFNTLAAEGQRAGLALVGSDPVGRLTWMAQGVYGEKGTWRGAAVGAAYRRLPVGISGELFLAEHHPSRQKAFDFGSTALDVHYSGGAALAERGREHGRGRYRLLLGASTGTLDGPASPSDGRHLAVVEYDTRLLYTLGVWSVTPAIALNGSLGSTSSTGWRRGVVSTSLGVERLGRGVVATATYGEVSRDASPFEQFLIGGALPGLMHASLLSQRIELPGVPVGFAGGRRAAVVRLALTGLGLTNLPLRPHYTVVSAGEELDSWQRIIGVESSLELPTLPVAGLPAIRVVGGASYALDEPFRHKVRFYLALAYQL
ncbi:MAG: TolB family protein [Gemmatimonadaceae bacterium]